MYKLIVQIRTVIFCCCIHSRMIIIITICERPVFFLHFDMWTFCLAKMILSFWFFFFSFIQRGKLVCNFKYEKQKEKNGSDNQHSVRIQFLIFKKTKKNKFRTEWLKRWQRLISFFFSSSQRLNSLRIRKNWFVFSSSCICWLWFRFPTVSF